MAESSSSLSSVVNNLVRASFGASVSSTVTDEELDRHVAELILKEAKQKAAHYLEHGVRAYLPEPDDTNVPKTNKRFLSAVIRNTADHNTAVLRAQATAAQEAKAERMEIERKERQARAQEATDAARMRRLMGGSHLRRNEDGRDYERSRRSDRKDRSDRDRRDRDEGDRKRRRSVGSEDEAGSSSKRHRSHSYDKDRSERRRSERSRRHEEDDGHREERSSRHRHHRDERDGERDEDDDRHHGRSGKRRERSRSKGKERQEEEDERDRHRSSRHKRHHSTSHSRDRGHRAEVDHRRDSERRQDGDEEEREASRQDKRRRSKDRRISDEKDIMDQDHQFNTPTIASTTLNPVSLQPTPPKSPSPSPGPHTLESKEEPPALDVEVTQARDAPPRGDKSESILKSQSVSTSDATTRRRRERDLPPPSPTLSEEEDIERLASRRRPATKRGKASTLPALNKTNGAASSSSHTPPRSPSPPTLSSKMDRYFDPSYDPRLDIAPLTSLKSGAIPTVNVPATGLIDDAEFAGWDAMLDIIRQRREDKAEKKRLIRLGIIEDDEDPVVKRRKKEDKLKDKEKGKKVITREVDPWAMKAGVGLMDIEYKKKGAVREWDMGKEGF